ncbi:MAG: alpha/beta hydrolase [Verrucomicrobia bacterium]|nr:alpha/beta hydrolase [Verrucomicrobiota bacterium]
MTLRRFLIRMLWVVFTIIGIAAVAAGLLWWYFHPAVHRTDGVVYGVRHEKDLTMDILRPGKPNGFGIALMVSGGWKSGGAGETPGWLIAPLLRRGYTVFAVCHISQPEATVMEIVEDVNRGIRFIRLHSADYGIDPSRIGVTGGSAGGHLSLMLATRGGPGQATATDPVDQMSNTVQAVAIFYPVTDLLNLGSSTENPGDGGPPKSFVKAFGPQSTNPAAWKEIGRDMSPIFHITSNMPPVLIYHGDADTLTPLDQSERFQAQARAAGRTVDLVVHPGGKHGWLTMVFDIRKFAAWFDTYLRR